MALLLSRHAPRCSRASARAHSTVAAERLGLPRPTGATRRVSPLRSLTVRCTSVTTPAEPAPANTLELVRFITAGVAVWTASPIMSLIDTSVVGLASTLELGALGPATALADSSCYCFTFLAVSTTSLVARALARGSQEDAQRSVADALSFAALCGLGLAATLLALAPQLLRLWTGTASAQLLAPASVYVAIRALGAPAALVTSVCQAAFLAAKQPAVPVLTVLVAAGVNLLGDLVLCVGLGQGLAGAAWATTLSQYVAAALILSRLRLPRPGNQPPLLVSRPPLIPSAAAVARLLAVGAPVALLILIKVLLISVLLGGAATSISPTSSAAHACLIGIYILAATMGDSVSQAAQSFLPATFGRPAASFALARAVIVVGMAVGAFNCIWAGLVPVFVPWMFTTSADVAALMRDVAPVMCASLIMHTASMATEGCLLAGRDLRWLVWSYAGNAMLCAASLAAVARQQAGLPGVWAVLAQFHVTRVGLNAARLFLSKDSPLRQSGLPPRGIDE